MRTHKVLSIIVFFSLLIIPLSGGMSINSAMAQDATPPVVGGGQPNQDAADVAQGVQPQGAQTGGSISYSTGTDPNQSTGGGPFVEVTLPASVPPPAGTALAAAPYQPRPEMVYSIKKSVTVVAGPHVLLLESDDDSPSDSPILFLLQQYGDLGVIDMFDAKTGTPTLAQLLPYDVVVTWSNYLYSDPVAIGNVLADYVDAGGKVVNLAFSIGTHGFQMLGRFMTGNYTAMNATSVYFVNSCLGSSNPAHPIMDGISNVCDTDRLAGTTLTAGSSSVAQWADGLLFVAAKDNRTVVTINGYVGTYFQWTGQMPDVLHNAILWLTAPTGCNTVLWNNGPLVTHVAGGFNNANASSLQSALGLTIYGFGAQFLSGNRVADDFTITDPAGWQIDQFSIYAYQTGTYTFPPASTITAIYYQIWNGPPNVPGSAVIYGNLTTNRLVKTSWSGTYRALDTGLLDTARPIMSNLVQAGLHLAPGTYWLDWTVDGSGALSGPWIPPITILGQTSTGNSLQYVATAWAPAVDTTYPQGMPFLVLGCSTKAAWQQINTNPIRLMDNVLAAYNGKVWSITGYGDSGVSYYTPSTGVWTSVPSSAPPFGSNYARSGCTIANQVYVYGDTTTSGFTGLWSYNMDTNTWTALTPSGTPPPYTGIWSPSWVADTSTNRCYMTGGATVPGPGTLKSVYVYNAAGNQWLAQLPDFTSIRDFHAAFIFTRPSDTHKLLCVAGGIAADGLNSTQCYDFNTAAWHAENADLGVLPANIWGMGYTQAPTTNGNRLVMVNGIVNNVVYNQTWAYSVPTGTWVNTGSLESGSFFRTSAVTLNRIVYHIGGSPAGFDPRGLADKYVGFPILLPIAIKH